MKQAKLLINQSKSIGGIKIARHESVKENMRLTFTEKDMLKSLLEDDHTEQCIIAFYLTKLANKSKNIKILASEFQIKSSWANVTYEIGKKLWFRNINRIKRMKRDIPIRLEGAA